MSEDVNYYFRVTYVDGATEDITATHHEETETDHVFTQRGGRHEAREKARVASVIRAGFEPFFIR